MTNCLQKKNVIGYTHKKKEKREKISYIKISSAVIFQINIFLCKKTSYVWEQNLLVYVQNGSLVRILLSLIHFLKTAE